MIEESGADTCRLLMALLKYCGFVQEEAFYSTASLGKQVLFTVLVSSGGLTVSFLCRKC